MFLLITVLNVMDAHWSKQLSINTNTHTHAHQKEKKKIIGEVGGYCNLVDLYFLSSAEQFSKLTN